MVRLQKKRIGICMGMVLSGMVFLSGCQVTSLFSEKMDSNDGKEKLSADLEVSGDTEYEEEIIEGVILPEEAEPGSDVTMVFSGDIMPSDYVLSNYDRAGISGIIDDTLLGEMNQADICMVNEEFPYGVGGTQAEDKQFTFKIDPSYISIMEDLGVDIVTLANNHTLDYGKEVLSQTFSTLDEAGIPYVGAGESLERASAWETFEQDGRTIGILAASRVIPVVEWDVRNQTPGLFTTYDPAILVSRIEAAKEECDFVAVYVHWGIERNEYPEDYQRQLAQQYIDAGADLVIGSHPHVLQGIEYYKGVPIVYSLGNYMFYQEIERTALMKIVWKTDGSLSLQMIPASASGAKTSACTGDSASNLLQYVENISFDVQIDEEGYISEISQ